MRDDRARRRLFAAILIRSSRAFGSLSEIEVEDGFSRGRRTRSAWLQSTWSAESCVSQKARSSASVRKVGTGFGILVMADSPLRLMFRAEMTRIFEPLPRNVKVT